ncbi:MAG: DMT family transporter [Bacteroidetes bacterium]|nr:DMT family transporter [Bacteroidota bacterium]
MNKKPKRWLLYAMITTIFWGIWGAFIEIPEKSGFPATLGYVVWSLTMVPCSLVALSVIGWKPETDRRSIGLGMSVGLLGAGGQLILFEALRQGPAYIVFPLISLFPVLTILLSVLLLKERASRRSWIGIGLALAAAVFLANPNFSGQGGGHGWLLLTILVFVMWGLQAYVMKFSNKTMKAESIFMYMCISALLLTPVAIAMTDRTQPINWGFKGPWLAAIVHILNSVGALTLVYALREGDAIIVVPLTGLSPVITIILSLVIYAVMPGTVLLVGLVLAAAAIYLLSE